MQFSQKGQRISVTTSQISSSPSRCSHSDIESVESDDGCEHEQKDINDWRMEDVEDPQMG